MERTTLKLAVIFLLVVMNVFSVLTMRQNMKYVADFVLEKTAIDGSTRNAASYFRTACSEAGIDSASASFSLEGTDYLNRIAGTVQYGDVISLRMTCRIALSAGGIASLPVTMEIRESTLSEVYYK